MILFLLFFYFERVSMMNTGLLSSSKKFIKRNSSTILTVVGATGVVATSVMAVKATPKALYLLEKAKEKKGEDLTKLEAIQVAGPVYIPSVLVGASTIACIFGANMLNKRNQAALMSAYALVDNSYKEYRNKVQELYGDDADKSIKEGIAKDKYEENDISVDDGKQLFYDYFSGRYFESTIERVQRAEYQINRNLVMRDYAYLNEWYEELGIDPIDSGWDYGWSPGMNLDHYWQDWVDFSHEKVTMDDGLECTIVTMMQEPILDFENYF